MQAANIHRMKSIDIFLRRNGLEQTFRIHMRGEWQLDQDSVHILAGIQLVDESQHFFRGNRLGRSEQFAIHAQFGAGLHFIAYIHFRSRMIADHHHGQARSNALGVELLYVCSHFRFDCGGDGISV